MEAQVVLGPWRKSRICFYPKRLWGKEFVSLLTTILSWKAFMALFYPRAYGAALGRGYTRENGNDLKETSELGNVI